MIQPGVFDFKMWQGATWHYDLLWEDGNPAEPVDLTDYEARMQVRKTMADTTFVLELTSLLGGGITLGGALGTIDFDLSAAQTTGIEAGRWIYDLELVTGTNVTRLLEGSFTVSGEVTR